MKKQIFILVILTQFFLNFSKAQQESLGRELKFYNKNELDNHQIVFNQQNFLIKSYNEKWISVWEKETLTNSKEQISDYYDKQYSEKVLMAKWPDPRKKYYAENKLPYKIDELQNLVSSMDLDNYPSFKNMGISCGLINLRELPTIRPKFLYAELGGEGYPFDYFQISSISINTPLKIIHKSKDGSWLFVETPNNSWGWVSATDVAIVNSDITDLFKGTLKFVSVIQDNVAITDKNNDFIASASIGASFPLVHEDEEVFNVLIIVKDENRNGRIKKAKISKSVARLRGLDFNLTNFHLVMSNLLDSKYGWGGNFQNRDCSQLFMEMFSIFGIWLPRDSKPQIEYLKHLYKYIQLSDTITTENYARSKELRLIELGKPYLTFIELTGHIMLYCGVKNDTAIVLHDVWGLRTNDSDTRLIIGKVCLIDLWAGNNYVGIDKNYLWIKRIKGFVILGEGK